MKVKEDKKQIVRRTRWYGEKYVLQSDEEIRQNYKISYLA